MILAFSRYALRTLTYPSPVVHQRCKQRGRKAKLRSPPLGVKYALQARVNKGVRPKGIGSSLPFLYPFVYPLFYPLWEYGYVLLRKSKIRRIPFRLRRRPLGMGIRYFYKKYKGILYPFVYSFACHTSMPYIPPTYLTPYAPSFTLKGYASYLRFPVTFVTPLGYDGERVQVNKGSAYPYTPKG